jgi:hypothetical protein
MLDRRRQTDQLHRLHRLLLRAQAMQLPIPRMHQILADLVKVRRHALFNRRCQIEHLRIGSGMLPIQSKEAWVIERISVDVNALLATAADATLPLLIDSGASSHILGQDF